MKPNPPIPPTKSPRVLKAASRPGCEILAVSAGADAARRTVRPGRQLAWFSSAPSTGFYSAVDKLPKVIAGVRFKEGSEVIEVPANHVA